jgi:lipopolysaccharide transport system permease protein
MNTNKKVYLPKTQLFLSDILIQIIVGFRSGWELGFRLFIRDLKVSTSKSLLGLFWLFLPPLATAGVWIFLNNKEIVTIKETPMTYAAYTLVGTMLWSLFAESVNKPIQRYQSSMNMMTKLNFPRESLVIASFFDLIFSALIKILILIPLLWSLGYPPTLGFFLAIPSALALAFVGLSFGLLFAPLGLLYGDISKSLNVLLPFVMYITPVIYPVKIRESPSLFNYINPVTPFLERSRSLFGGYLFELNNVILIWAFIISIIFLISLIAIKISLPIIIERSGS